MRQTDTGLLLLPSHSRRAWLRSFGLVLVALASALLGVALATLVARGSVDAVMALVAWALASMLAGTGAVMWPQLSARPYRWWNRVAEIYVHTTRFVLKHVCFWVILTPLRWTGAGLVLSRPGAGKTMWVPRRSLAPTSYGAQHDRGSTPPGRQGWIRAYMSWTSEFQNAWAVVLLPFLMVLERLEAEGDASVPTQTYTLF